MWKNSINTSDSPYKYYQGSFQTHGGKSWNHYGFTSPASGYASPILLPSPSPFCCRHYLYQQANLEAAEMVQPGYSEEPRTREEKPGSRRKLGAWLRSLPEKEVKYRSVCGHDMGLFSLFPTLRFLLEVAISAIGSMGGLHSWWFHNSFCTWLEHHAWLIAFILTLYGRNWQICAYYALFYMMVSFPQSL